MTVMTIQPRFTVLPWTPGLIESGALNGQCFGGEKFNGKLGYGCIANSKQRCDSCVKSVIDLLPFLAEIYPDSSFGQIEAPELLLDFYGRHASGSARNKSDLDAPKF